MAKKKAKKSGSCVAKLTKSRQLACLKKANKKCTIKHGYTTKAARKACKRAVFGKK